MKKKQALSTQTVVNFQRTSTVLMLKSQDARTREENGIRLWTWTRDPELLVVPIALAMLYKMK
jgi:hypothetical protein